MSTVGVLCFNRGCGETFNPATNSEGSCQFHPGAPFFHDAYKGWSCCKKKCTDFTEFLNIKGCTKGCHNSKKPEQPEKIVPEKDTNEEVIVYRAPKPVSLSRPSSDLPLKSIKPIISSSLEQQIAAMNVANTNGKDKSSSSELTIGTMCKNNGCKQAYEGGAEKSNLSCQYHPGVPIFHEGMKYWSCCKKKTSDFNAFLEQVGCALGEHCWIKNTKTQDQANCRLDWHQTGPWVVISIFAKKYDPNVSFVKLSAVQLSLKLVFPSENSIFSKNIELFGIVDVDKSCVSMSPTKVEIKLRKAEALTWGRLEYFKPKPTSNETNQSKDSKDKLQSTNNSGVESVDFEDFL